MGRMKDIYMDLIQNGDIPHEVTIGDIIRMKEMEITNWEEYEREQKNIRIQQYKSENPGEAVKIQQADGIFQEYYDQAKRDKEERSEQ
jgi:hypothetical protein